MAEYEFTLRFTLPPTDVDLDELVEKLYSGGCDDALIGVGQPGRLGLDFIREAESATHAVLSAIADVSAVAPEARLVEVSPDLVGLTDVAEIVGVSRQNVRKLVWGSPTTAPAPVHEGSSSLWHLGPILGWLAAEKRYAISTELLDLANATMKVNRAIDALESDPDIEREIRSLFARG